MDVPAPHGEASGVDVPDETLVKQRAEDTTGPEPAVGVLSERLHRPSLCMCPQTRISIYPRALFVEVPRRVAEAPGSRSQAPGSWVPLHRPGVPRLGPWGP